MSREDYFTHEELEMLKEHVTFVKNIQVEQETEIVKGFFVAGELIDWFALGEYE